MDKLYSLTAAQMKDLLDKREVTSVEITKSVIENIEDFKEKIESLISEFPDPELIAKEKRRNHFWVKRNFLNILALKLLTV